MVNIDLPQIQECIHETQKQAQRAQEIHAEVKEAIQIILKDHWLGEAEASFTQEAARLEASIQQLQQSLEAFIAQLEQASDLASETISSVGSVIANLP